jgi:hypothetical protein
MAAIGIVALFAAYSAGLYGYCLIRGYNVTPLQLFSFTTWPPTLGGVTTGGAAGQAGSTAGGGAAGPNA